MKLIPLTPKVAASHALGRYPNHPTTRNRLAAETWAHLARRAAPLPPLAPKPAQPAGN